MLRKRFFTAVLVSAIVMFGVSMLWHGVALNDLYAVPKPLTLFFSLAILVYFVIAFALTFLFVYLKTGLGIKPKGFLLGMAFGFFIYLIAFVLGLSFKGHGAEHIVVDFIWQMIEQGIGGATVGMIYALARRRDEIMNRLD